MAIAIDESVLLGVAGLVFIPLFTVLLKIFTRVGNLENRFDALVASRLKADTYVEQLGEHESDLRVIKMRIDNLEKKINNHNNK
jgi:Na+-transporting methylmalonyl-CoA/oxaloacetate decarboxylase gamma subunit